MPHMAYYADDAARAPRRSPAKGYGLAQWILPAEISAGEDGVDCRNAWRFGSVVLGKKATANKRDAHRPQIIRARFEYHHPRSRPNDGRLLRADPERCDVVPGLEWNNVSEIRGLHARNRSEAFEQLAIGCSHVRGRLGQGRRKANFKSDDVVRVEAGIGVRHSANGAEEKASTDQ